MENIFLPRPDSQNKLEISEEDLKKNRILFIFTTNILPHKAYRNDHLLIATIYRNFILMSSVPFPSLD